MQANSNGSPRPPADFSVVIPTINSSRYIEIILSFYREHEIPVTVFVDDRSVDDTLDRVRRMVPDARLIRSPGRVVEEMLPELARACATKWFLRIDDDELPSLEMIRFVEQAVRQDADAIYGFPRKQCAVSTSGQLLSHRDISPLIHRQWRLFQPARVRFQGLLHTSGFDQDGESNVAAPDSAVLIHLDWAVHSRAERAQKLARYDEHTVNAGARWRDFYLHDTKDVTALFDEVTLPEFRETGRLIAEQLGDLCVASEAIAGPAKTIQ